MRRAHKSLLGFGDSNSKLCHLPAATFSLPAGYTCPGANECLARYDRVTHKIVDGPNQKVRCYAAQTEAAYPSAAKSYDENWRKLREAGTVELMAELIDNSLPAKFYTMIRVHSDGDFWTDGYFVAWMEAARRNPDRLFYAYTKSLHFWAAYRALVPDNFVLTASWGGKFDHLIHKNGFKNARIVAHPEEAAMLGLQIDHEDSLARDPDVWAFALLIHNSQPVDTDAAACIKRLKKEKVPYSYGKKHPNNSTPDRR